MPATLPPARRTPSPAPSPPREQDTVVNVPAVTPVKPASKQQKLSKGVKTSANKEAKKVTIKEAEKTKVAPPAVSDNDSAVMTEEEREEERKKAEEERKRAKKDKKKKKLSTQDTETAENAHKVVICDNQVHSHFWVTLCLF